MQRKSASYLCVRFIILLALLAVSRPQNAADAKIAPPSADEIKNAMKLVRNIFKDDLSKAKKPAEKIELATKLITSGREEVQNVAGRFAMLTLARDLAADGGGFLQACKAIDELDNFFQIDALAAKADAASRCAALASTPELQSQILARCEPLIDRAISTEQFETAIKLGNASLVAARNALNVAAQKQVAARLQQVKDMEVAFSEVDKATAVLAEKPTDPDANLKVGRYLCLARGDWAKGLRMLAMSDDAGLKPLAAIEQGGATESAAQVELGDKWWDLAEKGKSYARHGMMEHAASLYEKAFPQLGGLAKSRVEKHLNEFDLENVSLEPAFLTDLSESDFHAGYGRVGKNGEAGYDDVRTVRNKVPILHGISIHPPSSGIGYITYDLPRRKYLAIRVTVGINDSSGGGRSGLKPISFSVLADDKEVWKSKPILRLTDSDVCDISVQGIQKLKLQVECPDWNRGAHGLWIDPLLTQVRGR